MEIRLIKKTGVPQAEIEAHKQIQADFDSTPFGKNWRGYASFAQDQSAFHQEEGN
jgi:hypothetical protein